MNYRYPFLQILLLITGLLTCCAGILFETQSQYSFASTQQKNRQLSTVCTRYKLQQLFTEQLLWYRLLAKITAPTASKEHALVVQRLLKNQENITTILAPVYTRQVQESLLPLLKEQVTQAITYNQACHANNNKLKRASKKTWIHTTDSIACILALENNNHDKSALQQLFTQHRALIEQELACEAKKSPRARILHHDALLQTIIALTDKLIG